MRPARDRDRSIRARLVSVVTPDSGPGASPSRSRMHSAYRSIGTSCTASFRSTTVRMIPASSPPVDSPSSRRPRTASGAWTRFVASRSCVGTIASQSLWMCPPAVSSVFGIGGETIDDPAPISGSNVLVDFDRSSPDAKRCPPLTVVFVYTARAPAPRRRIVRGGIVIIESEPTSLRRLRHCNGYSNPLSPLDLGFAPHGCRTLQWHPIVASENFERTIMLGIVTATLIVSYTLTSKRYARLATIELPWV